MSKLNINSATRFRAASAAAALAAALLAGCGGGGSDPAATVDNNKVPASALTSARAYTEFVGSLATSNTDEALSLEGVVAPVTEVADALTLS